MKSVPISLRVEVYRKRASDAMSASLPKADVCGALADVRFGPKADIVSALVVWSAVRSFTEFLARVLSLIPKPHSLGCPLGGTGNSSISYAKGTMYCRRASIGWCPRSFVLGGMQCQRYPVAASAAAYITNPTPSRCASPSATAATVRRYRARHSL